MKELYLVFNETFLDLIGLMDFDYFNIRLRRVDIIFGLFR
jgi:hypothetical protein